MKKEFNLVLNTPHAVEQSKRKIDQWFSEITSQGGQVFHLFIKPFKPPKTHKQLGAIYELCRQLSETQVNEHAGHSQDYWKRFYKLRAYVPLLKADALDSGDTEMLELIQQAGETIRASQGQALFKYDLEKILKTYNAHLSRAARKTSPTRELTKEMILDQAADAFIKKAKIQELATEEREFTIEKMIADNPAFSYAHASKEHLIEVINYILDDAAKRGVFVELKKDDE